MVPAYGLLFFLRDVLSVVSGVAILNHRIRFQNMDIDQKNALAVVDVSATVAEIFFRLMKGID